MVAMVENIEHITSYKIYVVYTAHVYANDMSTYTPFDIVIMYTAF